MTGGPPKPRPASKSEIREIKKLIGTNSIATVAKILQIPHHEIKRIVTKLKLI